MYPVLFQFGAFGIRSYGIIVALSFFIGMWLSGREARRKGIDPVLIQDFAFYALVGGVIGARLYFVVFSRPTYFLNHPWEILAIWHGGIGIIGALLGGLAAAIWYCRKKKLSIPDFADTLAPGIILGQAVGVFACLLNGDSYGRAADLAWAITYTDPRSMAPLNIPRHPVELYEMGAYLLVFLIVWLVRKKYRTSGFTFLTYLAGYGVARLFADAFRGDPAIFAWGIPAAQVFGAALLLVSLVGFYVLGRGSSRARSPIG